AESQNTIGWISNVHLKWDKLNSGLRKASVQLLPEQPSLCGYVLKVEGQNTSSGRVQSSQSSLIGRTPLRTWVLMARQAVSTSVKSGLGLSIRTKWTVPFHDDKPRYRADVQGYYAVPNSWAWRSRLTITFPRPPSKGHCVRPAVISLIF
ncbi:hypothetical protein D6C77_02815, partial [Aureobasidium pullulans]